MKVCSLCSGSKGNSYFVEINGVKILFDAGKNYKYLSSSLNELNVNIEDINFIFITHVHSDHISSLKNILKKTQATLCISYSMFEELQELKDFDRVNFFEDIIEFNGIVITALKSSHDSPDSRNYIIEYNNKKVSYITDTGYVKQKHFKNFYDSDVFLMESNHDIELLNSGKYPDYLKKRILGDEGHLSNNQAGFYLSKLIGVNTKKVLLIHLSEDNNSEENAINTVLEILNDYDVTFKDICCAKQNEISEVMLID